MRPPGSHDHAGIVSDEIGPLPWKPGELPGIIVKEDPVLVPRLTALNQLKGPPTQRMKGMGNAKGLRRTARQWCNCRSRQRVLRTTHRHHPSRTSGSLHSAERAASTKEPSRAGVSLQLRSSPREPRPGCSRAVCRSRTISRDVASLRNRFSAVSIAYTASSVSSA